MKRCVKEEPVIVFGIYNIVRYYLKEAEYWYKLFGYYMYYVYQYISALLILY